MRGREKIVLWKISKLSIEICVDLITPIHRHFDAKQYSYNTTTMQFISKLNVDRKRQIFKLRSKDNICCFSCIVKEIINDTIEKRLFDTVHLASVLEVLTCQVLGNYKIFDGKEIIKKTKIAQNINKEQQNESIQ